MRYLDVYRRTQATIDPDRRQIILDRWAGGEIHILTATSGDCNDAVGAVNPGATEICDNIDNNCNNLVDTNDPALVDQMLPTLQRVAGTNQVVSQKAVTGAEDFSYFQKEAPGFFFFLGGMTPGNQESFPHHTPDFMIDDSGLLLGVKALTELTLDYMNTGM